MLSITGSGVRLCDGITRREALRVGGLGFTGLLWSDWLRARAAAKDDGTYRFTDRLTGEEVVLGSEDFNDLCRIHLYDMLEQVARAGAWDHRRADSVAWVLAAWVLAEWGQVEWGQEGRAAIVSARARSR